MTIKLPEPEITLVWDSWDDAWAATSLSVCNLKTEDNRIIGYTADQLKQYARDVLEEAAKFCEDNSVFVGRGTRGFMPAFRGDGGIHQGMDYAGYLRTLKDQL